MRVRRREVLDVEEKPHPAAGLLADDSGLVFSVSPREEQARRGTRRPDYYPSLWAAIVRQRRGVLRKLEAHYIHEEADRWVVLVDHDGDKAEMHAASIEDQPCPARKSHPQRQMRALSLPGRSRIVMHARSSVMLKRLLPVHDNTVDHDLGAR